MSVRDFLNKGVYITDLSIATGAVPEVAPTLVTDGYPTHMLPPGVVAPFILGIVDLEGTTTSVDIGLYGYTAPPAAGSTLLSAWQLIDTVTIDEPPTLFVIPVVGFDRFDVKISAMAGGPPVTARVRLLAISPWAVQSLSMMGAVGGIASNVNLIQVAGTNVKTGGVVGSQGIGGLTAAGAAPTMNPLVVEGVDVGGLGRVLLTDVDGTLENDLMKINGTAIVEGGLAGTQGVGGAVADDVVPTANPIPVAAIVDVIPADATADGRLVSLITDLQRFLRTVDKTYDPSTGANLFSPTITDADRWEPSVTLVDTTDLAADTYYYPSEDGFTMDEFNHIAVEIVMSGGVTVTVEGTIDPTIAPTWVDITESVLSLDTGAVSAASFVDKTDILDLSTLNVERVRLVVVTADNTNAVAVYSRRRKG